MEPAITARLEARLQEITGDSSSYRTLSLLKKVNKNKQFMKEYVTDAGVLLLRETRKGNVDKVVDLLCRGAPFISDSTGVSPLHFAAFNNSSEITELLLNGGMLRDLKNKVERTPLHIAAQLNHVNVLKMLLTYGADPNVVDMMLMTPLHWASENGNTDCVKYLLQYGAKTGLTDNFDRTALDIAKNEEIVFLLENQSTVCKSPVRTEENILSEEDLEEGDECNVVMDVDDNFTSPKDPVKTITQDDSLQHDDTIGGDKLETPVKNSSGGQSYSTNEKDTLEMLKEHGIQMLELDKITTVHSAVESGQKVVLTEAGKLALNSVSKQTVKICSNSSNDSVVLVQNGKKCIKINTGQLTSFSLENDRSFLKSMTPSTSLRYFKGKLYSEEEDDQLKLKLQGTISKLRNEAKLLDIFAKRKFRQANLYQEQLLSLMQLKNKKQ